MQLNVEKEVAALRQMTVKQLRQRYAEVFGEETHANNKAWLVKRIAWRLQPLAESDLSEQAQRCAEQLADDADLRIRAPRAQQNPARPGAGTELGRKALSLTRPSVAPARHPARNRYKGQSVVVKVLDERFSSKRGGTSRSPPSPARLRAPRGGCHPARSVRARFGHPGPGGARPARRSLVACRGGRPGPRHRRPARRRGHTGAPGRGVRRTRLRAKTHGQARRTPRPRGDRRPARPLRPCVRRTSDIRRSQAPPPGHLPALPRSRRVDRLEGFLPGGLCLYERVLVPVSIERGMFPAWLYHGGARQWHAMRYLPTGTWMA
ncbi:MAG: hypothetical protein KatS3mg109_1068 [Pirellulaceae bacterium]|nr:MAG: hypothetical protein KatS3mg109_1068 [Pirellulaceae bacterium]